MTEELRSDYYGYEAKCLVCGRTKVPFGRSYPACVNWCYSVCPGYDKIPLPSYLFPGESEADFGFEVPR